MDEIYDYLERNPLKPSTLRRLSRGILESSPQSRDIKSNVYHFLNLDEAKIKDDHIFDEVSAEVEKGSAKSEDRLIYCLFDQNNDLDDIMAGFMFDWGLDIGISEDDLKLIFATTINSYRN